MPLADEEDEWEVEKIRGTKIRKGDRFYLVQWKGWPEDYNTWEHEGDCEHAGRMIDAFEAEQRSSRTAAKGKKKGKKQAH